MTDEQRPPQEIWLDDEALNDHFDSVKSRMRTGGASDDGWEDIPTQQNEFTRDLKRKG